MLFNSIEFTIFLPVVFCLYWLINNKGLKIQNFFLLIVSYIFYGWWDWRFLTLIIFSSSIDYYIGINLSKQKNNQQKRKLLLLVSITANIGFLFFFKYHNFFVENFRDAFLLFGRHLDINTLSIVLPVGISFYTFQTLSYSIDVYRGKLPHSKDVIAFFAYVSFFPQLVAGPIERATNLLPQFYKKRTFNYFAATDGMRQILWGFFKKIVIADNCAPLVNDIFNNYSDYSGSTLLLGAILFAFQIYGDFSGYSDIAIGTARLFGFNLMQNFAFPYFSKDIAAFWRRWHISLSTWFRDYVYIPLGGSRGSTWMKIRNTFAIFLISGFWHGANWTFLAWGFIHACFFLPLLLLKRNRKNMAIITNNKYLPQLSEIFQMIITFLLITLAWVFFRSDSIQDAIAYLSGIFSISFFSIPSFSIKLGLLIFGFIVIEWIQRGEKHALEMDITTTLPFVRYSIYFVVAFIILLFGDFGKTEFIYFAF